MNYVGHRSPNTGFTPQIYTSKLEVGSMNSAIKLVRLDLTDLRHAANYVCARAQSREDAVQLLDALGLLERLRDNQ